MRLLSEHLHCPVYYDNDVVAACLGETYFGDGATDFDYVIWGTGIGGGTVRYLDRVPVVSTLGWKANFEAWEADNGGADLSKKYGKETAEFTHQEWEIVAESFEVHVKQYVETHRPPRIIFGGGLAVRHADVVNRAGNQIGVSTSVTKFGDDSDLMGGFGLLKHGVGSAQ